MASQWKVSWHHLTLEIPALWTQGTVGSGVTVALLDTGLAAPHGLDRTDFEYLDSNGVRIEPSDPVGHGTSAGSTIACYAGGALGVAPHAKLVSFQVLGLANAAERVEAAMRYVLDHRPDIDVVSCSLVMPKATHGVRDLVSRLAVSGRVVIAAAGDDQTPMEFPEQTDDAITVAAVNSQLHALVGARTGTWIDVAAPGYAIPVVLPGGGIGSFSESSAAAAVCSGVAALILSTRPSGASRRALASGLEGLFKSTARSLAGTPATVGHGLIDPAHVLRVAAAYSPPGLPQEGPVSHVQAATS